MKRNIFIPLLIILTLIQYQSIAKDVKVRKGDTLSKIAKDNNLTIRSIMDENNIYNENELKVGDIIRLPFNGINNANNLEKKHIVSSGETVSQIASLYKIDPKELILLNKINDPNLLYPNQILILPKGAKLESKLKNDIPIWHVLEKGETLYKISNKYHVSLKNIIEINNIQDPNRLKPGIKIKIPSSRVNSNNLQNHFSDTETISLLKENKSKSNEIRIYGPLKIDWSSWTKTNTNYIATAKHNNGTPIFLALNCYETKINWLGSSGEWNQWLTPVKEYEFNLIDDICNYSRKFD